MSGKYESMVRDGGISLTMMLSNWAFDGRNQVSRQVASAFTRILRLYLFVSEQCYYNAAN